MGRPYTISRIEKNPIKLLFYYAIDRQLIMSELAGKKPDKKPKNLKAKVQVKVNNVVEGQEYICQLGSLTQTKTAEAEAEEETGGKLSLAFMMNFGKKNTEPVTKGQILDGNVNGTPFTVTIKDSNKPLKVNVNLP